MPFFLKFFDVEGILFRRAVTVNLGERRTEQIFELLWYSKVRQTKGF